MASRGVTLVLRASWFNRSFWIRAKEIAAKRVYSCRALTSPWISDFRPSMKVSKSCFSNQSSVWLDKCSTLFGGVGCSMGVAAIGGRQGSDVHECCRGGQQRLQRKITASSFLSQGSLLAPIKEDGSERSLLAVKG
ncbi:hypothetical protein B296_00002096 [Ensete ventricosum]|uniref:Uncharacterized protein n=1 Tax=Ensete ventricosum TaxID=4639 RepID=A0A426ZUC5_ENSVE|nr:hypothetical protein B296_00002096 [Ensete ventricosum]